MKSVIITGQSINKIVGGENAPYPIPWQAKVHVGGVLCGGTIIDETTILSAAH